VVSYGDTEIERALASLRTRGLTRTVHSTSNRATKYRHVVPDVLGLAPAETAVLSVLMLRGPQTVGELKNRTERQHRFASTDDVAATLAALAGRAAPLVRELARQPGQKDARWVHLLAPPTEPASAPQPASAAGASAAVPDGVRGYDVIAEFADLLTGDQWDTVELVLLDALADVEPGAGPLVDVGAGTGLGLGAIRRAAPTLPIVAIEPSPAMRAALHARLHDDTDLRSTTTVVPQRFGAAVLPERASAVVVIGVLGHLDDAERAKLWRYAASSMRPGAPVVVGLVAPARPASIPSIRTGEVRVGRNVVEGWSSAEPLDDRSIAWTQRFRIADADGHTLREANATVAWRCDGAEAVRAEIAAHGLTLTDHGDVVVVRREG
jgi:uncharacterized protein YceH (UPF0502 family)